MTRPMGLAREVHIGGWTQKALNLSREVRG
jgi:hypothetical protein